MWFILADKVVFLDRDGVINVKAKPHDYIKTWQEFKFLPHVAEAIKELNINGYKVVIISNQQGIAKGFMSLVALGNIHANMCSLLKKNGATIDDIFICPHAAGTCECRKPKIGLFLQAEEYYNVNKKQSYMIGDSKSDIEAGKNYGVRTIAINQESFGADFHCGSLREAVKYIFEEDK